MIDIDKKYRTRDGRSVRILCTDRDHESCVVALVTDKNNCQQVHTYNADGRINDTIDYSIDLIEVPFSSLTKGDTILVSNNNEDFVKKVYIGMLDSGVYLTENIDHVDAWIYASKYEPFD